MKLLKKFKKDDNSDYKEKLKQAKEKEQAEKKKAKQEKAKQKELKQQQNGKKKRKRHILKDRRMIEGKGTEFAPSTGYLSTASLVKTGNRYGIVLKVINTYGMNRHHKLGWAYRIIPQITVEGVRGYLFAESKPLTNSEQSNHFKNIVPATERSHEIGDTGSKKTAGDESRRQARIEDLKEASRADSSNEKAIDVRLHVLLVSKNPDDLRDQLRKLEVKYNKEISGIRLMVTAGKQEELFEDLLKAKVDGSTSDYTLMSGIYSGFDHVLRRGLNDVDGLPIGALSDSFTKGQAFMALNNSFKKRILIASHVESSIGNFDSRLSASSLWGQLVANNAMMYGHRTFHLVLNGHRYYGDFDRTTYSCPPAINKRLQYIDLAKGGLNPFQMFGDVNRIKDNAYITNIFNNNKEKLYHIMYLTSGRRLDAEKEDLKALIEQFSIDAKVWDRDHPERSKVIGIQHPETVKTFGDFIRILNNYQNRIRERSNSTEQEINHAKKLYQTVKSALNTHSKLFNTFTTLPSNKDKSKLQWYYDVSNISNPDIREAQFLNAFDYCTYTATENDIVMIHGLDKVSVETLQVMQDRLEELTHRGVRLAYCFDRIGTGEAQEKVPKANIFNTDGVLYHELEQQFDYTILGTMSQTDLMQYERKVRQQLTPDLREALMRDSPTQFQIRRTGDLTSNIINANFI
ncbi:TPA_asm: hypothetical protein GZX72_14435, partial [Listeria monocytogenes]|nr:hypothetical protein [Listeria monocytogenes]